MRDITAISVACNTASLIRRMYDAFRSFHPKMKLVIIDNSDKGDDCQKYLDRIASTKTNIFRFNNNLGHGNGLNYAMGMVKTKYALIMDSDTEIIKDPVPEMKALMRKGVYGCGWITEVGQDGYDYGTWPTHKVPVKYLHPYFCMIDTDEFFAYPPFVHHGAPFYKTMLYLHKHNLSHKIVRFAGLTGAKGMTINWNDYESEYVRHDFGGTRIVLRDMGRKEIEGKWEY